MRINDKENYNKVRDSISMVNLKTLLEKNNYSITKAAINSNVSASTFSAYMSGNRTPSLPTLINIANYFNTNIDYILGRSTNPIALNELDKANGNRKINEIVYSLTELPSDKLDLVKAYIKGLQDGK